jgi:hypothetical protein
VLGEAEFSVGVEEGLLADAPPGFEQLREQPRMRRLGDHRLVAVIGQVAVSAIDVAKRRRLDNQRIDARHAASCSRPRLSPALPVAKFATERHSVSLRHLGSLPLWIG